MMRISAVRRFMPDFLLSCYHLFLALLGAFLYGFPSKKLAVIGVTGTNGKSTVVEMCDAILQQAGYKIASISSIKFKIGDREWKNELKMTMPGRFRLQKFLRQAVNEKCQYAVLEVTSEGIKQHRHRFIDFDVAVLTNLTPEHIESHGSFEKYRAAKGKLFHALNQKSKIKNQNEKLKFKNKTISIVNLDDPNAEYFLRFPAAEKYGYTVNSKFKMQNAKSPRVAKQSSLRGRQFKIQNRLVAEKLNLSANGIDFYVNDTTFHLNLLGEFNVYNALAAICVGLSQGVDAGTIKKALEKIKGVPGRMEVVVREPHIIIVDYAHTPDSLRKVYQTLRKENSNFEIRNSKLICVLGAAGGGRDKWKRPEMGKIAEQYCDQIILTNEDPYDENPVSILEQIEAGFSQIQNYMKILGRQEAIRFALNSAKPGDVVVITGKGSEPWMCVAGGKKIPWDDRQIVREEMSKNRI